MDIKIKVSKLAITVTQICLFLLGTLGTVIGISYSSMVKYGDGNNERFERMPVVLQSKLGDSSKISTVQWSEYSSNNEYLTLENHLLYLHSGEIVSNNDEHNFYYSVQREASEWTVDIIEKAETASI